VASARTLDIILNPISGGGAGRRARPEISRALDARGVQYHIHETEGPGDARERARALSRPGAVIVAAGGDGTIHEVANGLLDAGGLATLGLIPVGTGNDFVKVVPGTRKREHAYETLASGTQRRFDAGLVRWDGGVEHFINGMGTGIDVEVVRQMKRLPQLPGPIKYLMGLFRALVHYRPVQLDASFNGSAFEKRVMIIALGNGVCQGGGFYLAPDAVADDGLLDLTVVDELNLVEIAQVLPRILKGTQRGHRKVDMRTGRRLEIRSTDGRPLFFHLDGELREPAGATELTVEVIPAALPVLAR